MKPLAKISATLFHRHYAERAFNQAPPNTVNDLTIITYSGVSSLKSTFNHLNYTYLSRARGATPVVIIGVGDLDEVSDKKLLEALSVITTYLRKDARLYLHAACHIKLLAHDGVAWLGSQNVSNGAESWIKDIQEDWKTFFIRNHEALVKIDPAEAQWIDQLVQQVLSDQPLYVQVTRASEVKEVAEQLLKAANVTTAVWNMAAALRLKDLLSSTTTLADAQASVETPNEIIPLIQRITQDPGAGHRIPELLEQAYGTADLQSIIYGATTADFLEVCRLIKADIPSWHALQEVLESPPQLKDSDESGLVELLREISFSQGLEHLEDYLADQRPRIIHAIMSNPDHSKPWLAGAIDNDGSISADRLDSMLTQRQGAFHIPARDQLEYVRIGPVLNELNTRLNEMLDPDWSAQVLTRARELLVDLERLYERERHDPHVTAILEKLLSDSNSDKRFARD